ncbi:MAG: vWA domain-containing protein [Pirellulaceae bacterium]|nr:vWA domain-containing protein [Pirellulaceae bacterium]
MTPYKIFPNAFKCSTKSKTCRHRRRGAAFVLIAAMLFVFLISAAFTVNYSYMQLVRSELRAATDAAAKAGAETLARTEDTTLARQEAIRYAAANRVGGQPFVIGNNDVVFGKVTPQGAGRWTFQSGGTSLNAVRINARTGGNAANSAIPLFFSQVLGRSSFTPQHTATAGQQEVEVCLCIDRSGSMQFDMSGSDWAYAPNNPLLSNYTAEGTQMRNYYSPPHPTDSRWAKMRTAVNLFLTTAGNYNPPPRTALVTWGSDITINTPLHKTFTASMTDIALPASGNHNWSTNMSSIQNAIVTKGNSAIVGGTNLSAGLDMAVSVMRGNNSSLYTNKVIILLTDGQWNQGRHPRLAAYDARAQGITVHAISMLTTAQPDLREVATITGGKYISTSNSAQLEAAFIELANSLPVVLTE